MIRPDLHSVKYNYCYSKEYLKFNKDFWFADVVSFCKSRDKGPTYQCTVEAIGKVFLTFIDEKYMLYV